MFFICNKNIINIVLMVFNILTSIFVLLPLSTNCDKNNKGPCLPYRKTWTFYYENYLSSKPNQSNLLASSWALSKFTLPW